MMTIKLNNKQFKRTNGCMSFVLFGEKLKADVAASYEDRQQDDKT
ncbi:hypothetical protein SDC49_04045 [Lactobacillus sp. R2/2]|nr:hypothetical protein [Lactobacillus sp. R2/2]